jgi:uracil phosphoribosyltransferase
LELLETILQNFSIDTCSTKRLPLSGLSHDTRLYKVDIEKSPLIDGVHGAFYLIDTSAGRKAACHHHIVSEELAGLCTSMAHEFVSSLKGLDLLGKNSGVLHILRGSLGYMVHEVLPSLPKINIRTQYIEDGYRSHSNNSRHIEVTYSDYKRAEYDSLIIPDTYATGRSVEAALRHMLEQGLRVDRVIIYGFIAVPSIERLYRLLDEYHIDLLAFAICDITQLYANNYDMPLYGIDEHLYQREGTIKQLGSIVSLDTLKDMIPSYIPGMDQPSDWSERHTNLFNGSTTENGDIRGHLLKSIEFIQSLDALNRSQPWYSDQISELTQKEISLLKKTVKKY